MGVEEMKMLVQNVNYLVIIRRNDCYLYRFYIHQRLTVTHACMNDCQNKLLKNESTFFHISLELNWVIELHN